jgi:ABC-type antimicrobial peptide transport system permease subunit
MPTREPLDAVAGVETAGARPTTVEGPDSSLAENLLFGVSGTDPATLLGVVLLAIEVAMLEGLIPAWRAARVDPASSLRCD